MKKRLLALLLCLVMLLSLFPATALAEGEDESDAPAAEESAPAEPIQEPPLEETPEEPVGSDDLDVPSDEPIDEPAGTDDLDVPSDEPEALPEEPEADELQEATASGSCGAALTWTLEDGVLTISGNGAMTNWSDSSAPWYSYRESIAEIVLPEGLTSIGRYAFQECKYVSGVTIPEGVTRIGDSAFEFCSALTGVTIPEGVTSIGEYAFFGCSSLTSVTIPAGVTSIGSSAFSSCSALTGVTIPAGVTSIGSSAFTFCSGLTSVTIPSSVTSIGNAAFAACDNISKVCIDDLDWWLGFSDSSGGDDLPHGDLYLNGELVTEITVPAGTLGLRPKMFYRMTSLQSVALPDGLRTIGDSAFSGCSALRSVTIPAGVTSIGNYAFSNCSALTSVTIPEGVTTIGYDAFYNCSSLTGVTIPSSVTSIGSAAFSGCSALTSVTILAGVTSIGIYAFSSCSALKTIFFLGDAPMINGRAFTSSVRAAALYPIDNETWTEDKRQNYGGTLIWTPYRSGQEGSPLASAVVFDPNGGQDAPETQYKGRGCDLKLSEQEPTRAYYRFIGWAFEPNAAEPDFRPGDSYTEDRERTLYAVWTPMVWPLRYQANGGTNAPADQTKTYGVSLTLPEAEPVREGFDFLGWSLQAWDGTPRYFPGGAFDENGDPELEEAIELYAVWQIKTYLVVYKSEGWVEVPAPQMKTHGRPITLSPEIPSRPGYTFLGWSTKWKATEAEYQPGERFALNANTVLYAVWEPETNARFVVGGGSVRVGDEIQVPVRIEQNPGVVSVEISVVYDAEVLEWTGVTPGEYGGMFDGAVGEALTWYAADAAVNETKDAVFVTLSFRAKAGAPAGTTLVTVSYGEDCIYNADEVDQPFQVTPGEIEIISYVPGDITGDGLVNNKDLTRLQRYLKGKTTDVVQEALDVNGDGKVNNKDATRLQRYLKSGDVEIY